MGRIALWLADGPAGLARRHGRLIGTTAFVAVAGLIFAGVWIDRGEPALADGLPDGMSRDWHFAGSSVTDDAVVLSGDWVPDLRGICRENLENPKPGSEKMGVLELAAGSVYGRGGRPFSVEARYFAERPAVDKGTEMDGGIAFGIRDAMDFDLLEQSALHDVLRLDHLFHGKGRDLRGNLYATPGHGWHFLAFPGWCSAW